MVKMFNGQTDRFYLRDLLASPDVPAFGESGSNTLTREMLFDESPSTLFVLFFNF